MKRERRLEAPRLEAHKVPQELQHFERDPAVPRAVLALIAFSEPSKP